LNTKGGHIAVGGGSAQTTWSGLEIPNGYATGDAPNTGAWWGAEIYGPGQNLAFIQTDGGNLRVYGATTAQASTASFNEVRSVYLDSAKIDLGSGTLNVWATGASAMHTATYLNAAIGLTNSKLIASGGITLGGTNSAAGTAQLIRLVGTNDLDAGSSGSVTLLMQGTTGSMKLENTLNVTGNLNIYASQTTSNISGAINATGNITATDSNAITTTAQISAGGNIALTADAGVLSVGGNLTSTGATRSITLRATADVIASNNITTSGGEITLGSDSDNANDGGIRVDGALSSSGGNITLSGGTSLATGFAKGTANTARVTVSAPNTLYGYVGVLIYGSLNSGAGNILIRGQDSSTIYATNGTNWADYGTGVEMIRGSSITATTGSVTIFGNVASNQTDTTVWHCGTLLGNLGSGSAISITTTTGNISITGDTSNNNLSTFRYGLGLYGTSVTSTSGNIALTANTGSLAAEDFVAGSSASTIGGGSGTVTVNGSITNPTTRNSLGSATFSSSSSVTINLFNPTFTATVFSGAADFVIQSPAGADSFASAVDFTNLSPAAPPNNVGSLTLGRATNNVNMTLGTAWNLWGPLTVHGASISANQNITVNKPAADMLFKAKANVSTAASRTLTTTGGDLILWANADKVSGVAGNGGRVYLASNTSLNSQGGGIYLGGGLDDGGADSGIPAMNGWSSMAAGDGLPDGFANGNNAASQNPGVWLDSGYSLSSNGGDIYIAGQDSTTNANSGTSANVIFHSGTIDSG
jgi:hypothetical protein